MMSIYIKHTVFTALVCVDTNGTPYIFIELFFVVAIVLDRFYSILTFF